MRNKSLRHISHYVVLLCLMVAGLIALTLVPKSTPVQTLILISISAAYFLWGVIHSSLERELHSEILMEYLLYSLLGLFFILGVFYYL
jgi:fructose-specific phosphotransferase system IIC component